jgi:hypothetical protein
MWQVVNGRKVIHLHKPEHYAASATGGGAAVGCASSADFLDAGDEAAKCDCYVIAM